MKTCLAFCFTVLHLLFGRAVFAQSPPVAAESVLGRMTLTNDIGSLLSDVKPLARDAGLRNAAEHGISGSADEISRDLKLTGDAGYLVQVVIQTETATGISSIAGGSPLLVGSGKAPADVLSRQRNRLLPGPRSGFDISKENSFYIWIRPGERGKLEYGLISYPFSKTTELEAVQLSADAMLMAALVEDQKAKVVEHMIDALKSDANTRARAANCAKIWEDISQDTKIVNRINSELKAELDRAASADAMIARLNMVKGMIHVATEANEAATLFNDPSFLNIKDSTTLVRSVETAKREKNGLILTYRSQLEVKKADRSKKITDLRSELKGIGVPERLLLDVGL